MILTIDTVKKAIDKSRFLLILILWSKRVVSALGGQMKNRRLITLLFAWLPKYLLKKEFKSIFCLIICKRIEAWDHENIEHLLDMIRKNISILELNPDDHTLIETCVLDINNLPSEVIPKDMIPHYRIWAMDKKGMCLVGDDANKVVHIDNIPRKK